MSRTAWLVLGVALVLAGCKQAPKEEAQYDDPRNPFYKQAQQDLDSNNPNAAILDYEAALNANPKLAGAHYNLGLIYADKLSDPVGAIFHFKQFLILAPNSEKADEVKASIDKQSQAFIASVPNATPPPAPPDVVAKLQGENAALTKQVSDSATLIAQLQKQLKSGKHHVSGPTPMALATPPPAPMPPPAPVVPAPVSPPAVGAAPATAPAAPTSPPRAMPVDAATAAASSASETTAVVPPSSGPARSYKIVSGDSIWKISHKMYPGDTKNGMERIKEANKDILIEGKPLKIGQVLVIP